MRLTIVLSLFIKLAVAQISFKSCSYNEICVNIQICPMYKQYQGQSFKSWPNEIQSLAKSNLCNREKVDQSMVISVCCPSVLNPKTCGVQAGDKISGGQVAKVFQFPWMVLLYSRNQDFVCGGTLVSAKYVLTAAHCVINRNAQIISVRVGEHDLTKEKDCNYVDGEPDCADPPQDIEVDQIIRHPKHSDRAKKNDIALIRLRQPAIMKDSVRPICLPNGTPEQRRINPSFMIVTGWGLTEDGIKFDVLRYARLPPVSLEDCGLQIRGLDTQLKLDQSQICAGGVDKVDNCAGDSGGPLQYISNQTYRYIQYGVVSYGLRGCGDQSLPGVYTNVLYYLSWIFETVNE